MNPLDWRAAARETLTAAGERCFVRFARPGENALFLTDARDVSALEEAGFCVRARRGRVCAFDVPDAWYATLTGCVPAALDAKDERSARLLALWRRLRAAARDGAALTDEGRAFLRETARGCFAPGGADEKTVMALRAQAAVLQRRRDTGALAAAAGLAAAAVNQEGLR